VTNPIQRLRGSPAYTYLQDRIMGVETGSRFFVWALALSLLVAGGCAFAPSSVHSRGVSFRNGLPSPLRSATQEEQPGRDVPAAWSAVPLATAFLTMVPLVEPACAAAPEWVAPVRLIFDPLLLYFEFAFVCRIVLSWYPNLDLNQAPQNLVAWPTEPLLKPTRGVVPPAFGVDISPVVWVGICSFFREILFGQQGILNLLSQK
jgi:YggT family protein